LIAENGQRGRDYGGVRKGLRDDGIKGGKSIEEVSKKTLRLFGAEEERGIGEF
jgi:hypothetical protein